MSKDFDGWNELKKSIDAESNVLFCNPREIWWASVGLNIGSEENGKNSLFERPVLIIKVFNRHMARIVPLTSNIKNDRHRIEISFNEIINSAIISQTKTISTKRLSRKLGKLDENQFKTVVRMIKKEVI